MVYPFDAVLGGDFDRQMGTQRPLLRSPREDSTGPETGAIRDGRGAPAARASPGTHTLSAGALSGRLDGVAADRRSNAFLRER